MKRQQTLRKYQRKNKSGIFDWDNQMILDYFREKGIGEDEIMHNDSHHSLCSKVYGAAELFKEHRFNNFSGTDIAMLVYIDKWGRTEEKSRGILAGIYQFLSKYYEKNLPEQKQIANKINMPCIHLLRIHTGNNRSNLHKIYGYDIDDSKLVKTGGPIYKDVISSPNDWQNGVRLPLPEGIDFDIAKMLGYIWASGFISVFPKVSAYPKGHINLFLSGKEKQEQLFHDEIKPLADKIFNVEFNIAKQSTENVQVDDDIVDFKGVLLYNHSQAIAEFLVKIHRFPIGKKDDIPCLPDISWNKTAIDGFLTGFIDVKRNWSYPNKNDRLRLWSKGEQLGKSIDDLFTQGDYGHSLPLLKKRKKINNEWFMYLHKSTILHFKELMYLYPGYMS